MCPSFAFTSVSTYLMAFATGSSVGAVPVRINPVTTRPVTPRFCGSAPQLPSSFWDFLRNAAALSAIAFAWSAGSWAGSVAANVANTRSGRTSFIIGEPSEDGMWLSYRGWLGKGVGNRWPRLRNARSLATPRAAELR